MRLMTEVNWDDKWRLGFHLMPPTGWLNDPNGLCQFQGIYHVFFQYSPDDPNGGTKYWGHYTSQDMLNWQYVGIALSPEEVFESHGVYSGSALVKDGKMNLYYTGNVKLDGDYDYIYEGRQGNTILVDSEDGVTFGRKKCLMTNADYPSHLSCHIRDPKVVTGESIGIEDENCYMFLGARTREDTGEVLLYKSGNLTDWELVNILKDKIPFGYMWECPDAFMLDGKKFLSISPQGVQQDGINYQNVYQSGYYEVTGSFDHEYQLERFKEWDRGFDFYAPQTFQDENGRRILIGWIGMPDEPSQTNPTVAQGWQNALTVPREIFLKEGKVMQYPVAELEKLRLSRHTFVSGCTSERRKMYDAEITVVSEDIKIVISEGIELVYDKTHEILTLSFDQEKNLGYGRNKRSVHLQSCEQIRILVDTSCLEIYLNGGEEVFTTRFYTEDGMSDFCVTEGDAKVTYWEMEGLHIDLSAL